MAEEATMEEVIDIATRMAQELHDFVGDAIESSDDENALKGTQTLIEEWESIFTRTQ